MLILETYFFFISLVKEMAQPNGELSPINGYLTFEPGVSQRQASIRTVDDNIPEDDTSYIVVLYSPTGGARLNTGTSEFKLTLKGNFKKLYERNLYM